MMDEKTRAEKYLRTSGIGFLIDRCIYAASASGGHSPKEAFGNFQQLWQSNENFYYDFAVQEFEKNVSMISETGFGGDVDSFLITFAVPTKEGELFQLFPHGSSITVTPTNYEKFQAIYATYKRLQPRTHTAEYVAAVTPHLPLSAAAVLLSPSVDYAAVLRFLKEMLMPGASVWCIADERAWDALGITYAVPFRGMRVAVNTARSVSDPVPFGLAASYIQEALAKVAALSRPEGSSLSAVRASFDTEASPPLQQQQKQKRGPAEADDTRPRPEKDVEFWNYLRRIESGETEIPAEGLSFAVRIGERLIELKRNGEFMPLTRANLAEFLRLASERRDEILEAFSVEEVAARQLFAIHPPEQSRTWNRLTLTRADAEADVVRHTLTVARQLLSGELTPETVKGWRHDFFFALPCGEDVYELVPDGRTRRVVSSAEFAEFARRVVFEVERAQTVPADRAPPLVQLLPPHRPHAPAAAPGLTLTQDDLGTVFAAQAATQAAARETPASLHWCLPLPERGLAVNLRGNGSRVPVAAEDVGEYVQLALQKLIDISQGIVRDGFYTVPAAELAEAAVRRPTPPSGKAPSSTPPHSTARKLSATPTQAEMLEMPESQRKLFSPTHEATGLFSPPQYLNC